MINDRTTGLMFGYLGILVINICVVDLLVLIYHLNIKYLGAIWIILILFESGKYFIDKVDKKYPKKRIKKEAYY